MFITKDYTAEVIAEADRLAVDALEEVEPVMLRVAKAIVPVKTGALRDSIEAEVEDKKLTMGSPLVYAPKIEVSQPYLRPALEVAFSELRRLLEK